ncbi:hypothetical protein BAUCODRAFT_313715 [Baudoinia panamericana UAMH 10762]|uniref:Uncharacterized protein n=1 Tax=Baudoinia panamericana (strain UAMH 10762) TaxID=717646 RepID=M2M3G5_BAUPA|nr:uncharacterized protein BAUCODRAFT_313715 [Baudoinia panamericana UAMH 10762]EMC91071.1 hypothetical protein BAUCODRAFT_313715 [Baudoinia panamericana UAMH 10762]
MHLHSSTHTQPFDCLCHLARLIALPPCSKSTSKPKIRCRTAVDEQRRVLLEQRLKASHEALLSSLSGPKPDDKKSPTVAAVPAGQVGKRKSQHDTKLRLYPPANLIVLCGDLQAEVERREALRPPAGVAELEAVEASTSSVSVSVVVSVSVDFSATSQALLRAARPPRYLMKRQRRLEQGKRQGLQAAMALLDERQLRQLAREVLAEVERRVPEVADAAAAGRNGGDGRRSRLSGMGEAVSESVECLLWHKDLERVVGSAW